MKVNWSNSAQQINAHPRDQPHMVDKMPWQGEFSRATATLSKAASVHNFDYAE